MKLKLMEIVQRREYITDEQIEKGLRSNYIDKFAYIWHYEGVDEDGKLIAEHIHIALKLKDATNTKYIAKAFCVPESCVIRHRGRWMDALSGLTIQNSEEKRRYSIDEVTSNFDWQVKAEKRDDEAQINEIIKDIMSEKIKAYNYFDYITPQEYIKFRHKIGLAYRYRADKKTNKRWKAGKKGTDVIFISGTSGCGKTKYAEYLAEKRT